MFKGTIPQPVQQMMKEAVKGWETDTVYVGCAGNFTVERVLFEAGIEHVHSNDVTIYSSMIGRLFSGVDLDVEPLPLLYEVFPFVAGYCDNPTDTVATMLLLTGILDAVDRKTGSLKTSPYYARLARGLGAQFETLHKDTLTKLESRHLALNSYTAADVTEWVRTIPPDAGFVCYPPFYGASGYEAQFGKLENYFSWEKPTYADFNADGVLEQFLADAVNRKYWLFFSKFVWPRYQDRIRGFAKTRSRAVPIYLYASHSPLRIVGPPGYKPARPLPLMRPGDRLGDTLSLAIVKIQEFDFLRAKFLDPAIVTARPKGFSSVVVLSNGRIVGVFAWYLAPRARHLNATLPPVYQFSDFAVAPTDYQLLSKLVLYASVSREAKLLAERLTNQRIKEVVTTAFSKNPTSMKYRGVFTMYSREELPEDDPHNFQINYTSPMGRWSLQEGFELWKQKNLKP